MEVSPFRANTTLSCEIIENLDCRAKREVQKSCMGNHLLLFFNSSSYCQTISGALIFFMGANYWQRESDKIF